MSLLSVFGSFVIKKERQHCGYGQSACNIGDVIEYLMQVFSVQSRSHFLRVFKLCCLAVETCDVVYPSVSISRAADLCKIGTIILVESEIEPSIFFC